MPQQPQPPFGICSLPRPIILKSPNQRVLEALFIARVVYSAFNPHDHDGHVIQLFLQLWKRCLSDDHQCRFSLNSRVTRIRSGYPAKTVGVMLFIANQLVEAHLWTSAVLLHPAKS